MKLVEAYEILNHSRESGKEEFNIFLACGFNALHFEQLLAAHFQVRVPEKSCRVKTGIYGNLEGNLERCKGQNYDASVILIEWSDLDPRLGIRRLGGWMPSLFSEIIDEVKVRIERFHDAVCEVCATIPVVICLPTLPLPPIAFTPGWQASTFELELRSLVDSFGLRLAKQRRIRVVNPERLGRLSPVDRRLDVKSELLSGVSYRLSHADALASQVATLLEDRTPKKGVITDLDDTLWKGIVGEVGVDAIAWDLEHGAQVHGLYQQVLNSLAATGVLIGIATKNHPKVVEQALERKDLVLDCRSVHLEAGWAPKSQAVERIINTWNIAQNAVVFIDDSSMELAEVRSKLPGIECIQFPTDDWEAANELLRTLRDLFGKTTISPEDLIRGESIRVGQQLPREAGESSTGTLEFLQQAGGEITLNFSKYPLDQRPLELINKTNQFNLNGKRYTEATWSNYVADPHTVYIVVSYTDKYGPLGRIAVLTGHISDRTLRLETWVMSCRAFSRRIEHTCLRQLFSRLDIEEVEFEFKDTGRNGPICEFLTEVLGEYPQVNCLLRKETFMHEDSQQLHQVHEMATNG